MTFMNRVELSLVSLAFTALFACGKKPAPPAPANTPVNLVTVKLQKVLYYDLYPSTTQALSQVDLRPEVQGYITGIFFKEGDHVRKGQKLYEIDRRLYQANYDQAVDNLKVAQGNEKQMQQDADRYEYLNKYNAIAKQVLDHAVIAAQNAKSSTLAAEQALKTAATNLGYSEIYAPFDGTIGFSQVKMGNLVSVGTTVLNTISTNDPMAVDFLINESQLAHYEDLKNNKQQTLDSLFTIQLPDHSIYPYEGRISVIDRAVDPQTGTIRVRLEFPNPKDKLVAGMSCVVRIHNEDETPQMLIPGRAVVEQMGEYFVYVAKDTVIRNSADFANGKAGGSDGGNGGEATAAKDDEKDTAAAGNRQKGPRLVAIQVKVETGQTIGPNIVILSGLHPGEKIVVDGVQALHDGSPITTANRQGPAAQGRGR
jgi:membrane fusion protein, multidrug efflux system